ncbi:MAG TPA: ubiquinol-cytochrome c reductase iron-sulfur subunit [Bacillales bacterium]
MSDHDVTRRQFLNYTLTGVGGFMAATMTLPMVRFAIDPLLKEDKGKDKFTKIDLKVSDLTTEPQEVKFTVQDIKDGWYKFDQKKEAFVFKTDDGEIIALSPVCTHLGCLVHWSPEPPYPNRFQCPCHGSRFTKTGVNIAGLPATAPLHVYEVKKEGDNILLGEAHPRLDVPAVPPSY